VKPGVYARLEADVVLRIMWEEDVRLLFGPSALVTGVPGPHACARMAAVAHERELYRRLLAEYGIDVIRQLSGA
jgi:hypothetical protein